MGWWEHSILTTPIYRNTLLETRADKNKLWVENVFSTVFFNKLLHNFENLLTFIIVVILKDTFIKMCSSNSLRIHLIKAMWNHITYATSPSVTVTQDVSHCLLWCLAITDCDLARPVHCTVVVSCRSENRCALTRNHCAGYNAFLHQLISLLIVWLAPFILTAQILRRFPANR